MVKLSLINFIKIIAYWVSADVKNTFVSDPPARWIFFLILPVQEASFGEKTFFQIYKIH